MTLQSPRLYRAPLCTLVVHDFLPVPSPFLQVCQCHCLCGVVLGLSKVEADFSWFKHRKREFPHHSFPLHSLFSLDSITFLFLLSFSSLLPFLPLVSLLKLYNIFGVRSVVLPCHFCIFRWSIEKIMKKHLSIAFSGHFQWRQTLVEGQSETF